MGGIPEYIEEQSKRFEADLCEWLKIPSVSADKGKKQAMRDAADWLTNRLEKLGMTTERIGIGEHHPIVYAESPKVDEAPTVLVYGHYDVQPAEADDPEWNTDPFEPVIRDNCVYARGASDDKGQSLTHVFSAEAWQATEGKLPVNLKYVIEGEEEVGSGGLHELLKSNPEKLACDCIVVSDCAQYGPAQPAITYGLRGIAAFELRLTGPQGDLHSGVFGGAITNPANALMQMLGALVDERGKVTVPGFYDDVHPITETEHNQFALLPFDEKKFYASVGVKNAFGESGFTPNERRWARPSFDINGITSGYQDEGSKTIIPATASAKFSMRLVPEQDPKKITASLRNMLESLTPPGIQMELIEEHADRGIVLSLDSPYMEAAARSVEYAFNRPPVFTREGGSIPIIAAMFYKLNADVLLLGWGQNDDNIHGPNERFHLIDFHRGIKASARLLHEISRLKR